MRSLIAFVLAAFIGLLVLPFTVLAIDYNGISARPANPTPGDERTSSWFVYTLAPGEIKKDTLIVTNNTDAPQDLELYPADSAATTGGGFALKQRVQEMTEVGHWITLEKTALKLGPHAAERVNFSVQVPVAEPAGLWSGGIMVAAAGAPAKTPGVSFNIRLGVRMYVTVAPKTKVKAWASDTLAVVGGSVTALVMAGLFALVLKRRRAVNKIT